MHPFSILLYSSELSRSGISVAGAALVAIAVVCSWTRNRSVFWAFIAGIFNIFYVIYWLITRNEDELRK
ncbi:MAG: hypothetical protein WBG46_06025 [Nonlabens sp.]